MIRIYSELVRLRTFKERYNYLRLSGSIGKETFGFDRFLNQALYTSKRWRKVRDAVIVRDEGCDLGILDYQICDKIIVHHMNPLTIEAVEDDDPSIYDLDFLICTSLSTHNAIHFGDENLLPKLPIVRTKNDTCPWR